MWIPLATAPVNYLIYNLCYIQIHVSVPDHDIRSRFRKCWRKLFLQAEAPRDTSHLVDSTGRPSVEGTATQSASER